MSYRAVQPKIARYAQKSPENLQNVLTFVLLTIQQPIESMGAQLSDVRKKGSRSRYLFGPKSEGYKYVSEHKVEIYETLQSLDSTLDRLTYLANLPGFGLPKAGFILQLVYGEAGCIDTHNLKRFGIEPGKRFNIKGQKPETQERKARDYIDLCDKLGGSESLWDSWCEYVAQVRPYVGDAETVSRLHLACMVK